METQDLALLQERMADEHYQKLMQISNPKLHGFVADSINLCNPDSVYVITDSDEDIAYARQQSVKNGEESLLKTDGHTYHFDGYNDQARDKARTKYLVTSESRIDSNFNSVERIEGIEEVRSLLKNSMVGRQMLVCFWCLGPTDSEFSIPCAQITDSAYVAHSESILYRRGYEQFKKIGSSEDFFRFIHTAGEMENSVSINVDKRRVYMDLEENMVYSTNTQYAGNTVGLKKLALRLAIQKASREGWLAEHMFIMGTHGPNGRVTYFAGAFPSACGKTSTSMIPGQTIVGDDIAYLRKKNGRVNCVNVEKGIFGIIRDVNPEDDPVIYDALTKPGEVIFSNILIDDNMMPHWLGMGKELAANGTNHSGKNISELSNRDPLADDPAGVPVGGIIYGGRDSDTWVPVEQAYNWTEGIIAKGASIESETTAATLGKEGVRTFNIMANMDFLSIPFDEYIQNNLNFEEGIDNPPLIFSVNYFLKDKNGKYLNGISDKKIWVLWAELRAHGDVDAIETPTGLIPKYEDLAKLFADNLDFEYSKDAYVKQFTIRIPENLKKLDRIEDIYKNRIKGTPKIVFEVLGKHRTRLEELSQSKGQYVSPFDL